MKTKKADFLKGLLHGIPIMLGYLSVSFGFGLTAVKLGISALGAVGISLTNLTSAGQFAGILIIAAGGSLIEMAITQFFINLRYALMGFSLTQRLDDSFTTFHRLILSFGITDEIFAVASSQAELLTPAYLYGLELTPILGWTAGTFLGAVATGLLPKAVGDALGLMLYAMFIAIIIPPAKRNYRVLIVILLSVSLSVLFTYVFTFISTGFSIIICALVSSVIVALLFPYTAEDDAADREKLMRDRLNAKAGKGERS